MKGVSGTGRFTVGIRLRCRRVRGSCLWTSRSKCPQRERNHPAAVAQLFKRARGANAGLAGLEEDHF